MINLQYFRIDGNGQIVEALSEWEDDELVVRGWTGSLCDPVYDFTFRKWVEGLSEEEIEARRNESPKPSEFDRLKADNKMNAFAIMELAQIVLMGGK